jgi:uncharacterized protein (DUF58 family)
MSCRPHGRKSTLALWVLVALADVAILAAAAGVLVMVALLLAVVVGAVFLTRRDVTAAESVSRRRA